MSPRPTRRASLLGALASITLPAATARALPLPATPAPIVGACAKYLRLEREVNNPLPEHRHLDCDKRPGWGEYERIADWLVEASPETPAELAAMAHAVINCDTTKDEIEWGDNDALAMAHRVLLALAARHVPGDAP